MISYSKIALWFLAAVAVIFLVFSISVLFTSAEVTVFPKKLSIPVDLPLVAKRAAESPELPFEIVNLSDEATEIVTATGEKYTETKASGKIVIYNNYSATTQRLIKNTRFETPDGLIFRINQSVTVPGLRKENGAQVPGSVEVTVYADQSGTRYNIGLTDFTVPGFKSDGARYKGFYARSKTKMTGGFTGMQKFVSPENLRAAREKLDDALDVKIAALAKTRTPAAFWSPNGGAFTIYESLPQAEVPGGKVKITERASTTVVIFDKVRLSEYLASKVIPDYAGEKIMISNFNELSITFDDKSKVKPLESSTLVFSIKGAPKFVWLYDAAALRDELLGKPKRDADDIFKKFTGIERTEVIIRPFWKKTFPSKPTRIKIETNLPLVMSSE